MDLSIVIPAYNEAEKIARDVEAAAEFLAREGLTGEIIVVDDGSEDETARIAEEVPLPEGVERRVIRYTPNRGKGCAVRTGMVESRGDLAMFADVGLCVPFENALRGIEPIRSGRCQIAHGSRRLPQSVLLRKQKPLRRLLSWLFRKLVGLWLGIPGGLTDTQCGFKVYRGDVARELYGACRTDGFMFDIEVLLRALQKGYRVIEFPIEWCCDYDSRVHPIHHGPGALAELREIRRRLKEEKGDGPTEAVH